MYSKRKILLVEDEGLAVLSLKIALQMLGFNDIKTAASGESALALVARETPDLVMVDLRLNGTLDGIETVLRMRRQWPVPVIFMTGYQDAETTARIARIPQAQCLFKPFTPDDVAAALRQIFEGEA